MKEKIIAWTLLISSIPAAIFSGMITYVGFSLFSKSFLLFFVFYNTFFVLAMAHSLVVLLGKKYKTLTVVFMVFSVLMFILHILTLVLFRNASAFILTIISALAIMQCAYQIKK
mgnify:CR=1 FL=1